eukprot:scaffold325001_cov20-Prasinocladus_malaysianus.AAC.1
MAKGNTEGGSERVEAIRSVRSTTTAIAQAQEIKHIGIHLLGSHNRSRLAQPVKAKVFYMSSRGFNPGHGSREVVNALDVGPP